MESVYRTEWLREPYTLHQYTVMIGYDAPLTTFD